MKIIIATYEYPPDVGGIAAYLSGLVGALPHESDVLRLKRPTVPLRWLFDLPRVWSAARKADLLVVSHLLPLGTLAWITAALTGKPYAVIVHGTDLKRAASRLRKRALARRILSGAAFVAANSEFTIRLALPLGASAERSTVVYPCPSAAGEGDGEMIRKRHGLHGKKVILTVARLVKRKGVDCLIDIVPKLRQDCGDVVLLIVGSGPEESGLKNRAARLRLGAEAVVFAGRVPDEELPSYFRAADIFALAGHEEPDDVEGFGLAYLEAASYGLASVAGRAGGAAEAVVSGQTGIVVDPRERDELFSALRELLTDPARAASMGARGRKRVLDEFTWEKQAAKFSRMITPL